MKFRLVMIVACVFGLVGCDKDGGTNAEPESELLAVTELKVTRIGRNAVRVEWKDNSRGEEGYLVERKANEGAYQARLFATLDAAGVVDSSGLLIDTTYAYRVQPIRYFERGPLSDPVTIRLTLPFP
ncbi:MAG: fibronectin type III domain-containing protein [Bacteroidota bacterium]